ncbi:TRAP transporter substrate-binding protein [Winogradskyella sp.]|uniref:TRAP transporter substrate-binding protein n=1 Tax=Winogradskyella sp. TaxID=1883156 RepID=UPI00261D2EE9|nr:TRAP transporter substrate-binding protein [Winogradskyella sp.]
MVNRLKFLFILLVVLIFFGCAEEQKVKVLRLAHGLDTNHPVHKAMVELGKKLKEKSKGRLIVKLYPSGQLGAERECLELLQIGSLDITKVSAAVLENFVSDYKVLSIPYLFRDRQHAYDFYDSAIGKELLHKGGDYRLMGLCYYDAGSRSFYTKTKAISSPNDLEGLKIRVQKSNMAVEMVKQLGGAPTPISWGELYTALQQGVVDGAENNLPSFFTSKHYEVCKYYSFDEHTAVPDILLIGTESWNRLNTQEHQWLQEAADESAIIQRQFWKQAEQEALETIKRAGVRVNYPDKNPFSEKTRAILNVFEGDSDAQKLISDIKSINE